MLSTVIIHCVSERREACNILFQINYSRSELKRNSKKCTLYVYILTTNLQSCRLFSLFRMLLMFCSGAFPFWSSSLTKQCAAKTIAKICIWRGPALDVMASRITGLDTVWLLFVPNNITYIRERIIPAVNITDKPMLMRVWKE